MVTNFEELFQDLMQYARRTVGPSDDLRTQTDLEMFLKESDRQGKVKDYLYPKLLATNAAQKLIKERKISPDVVRERRSMLRDINPRSRRYRNRVRRARERKLQIFFYQRLLPYTIKRDKNGNLFAYNLLDGKRIQKRIWEKNANKVRRRSTT